MSDLDRMNQGKLYCDAFSEADDTCARGLWKLGIAGGFLQGRPLACLDKRKRLMLQSFRKSEHRQKLWGRPPGLRSAPWPACLNVDALTELKEERDEGVPQQARGACPTKGYHNGATGPSLNTGAGPFQLESLNAVRKGLAWDHTSL